MAAPAAVPAARLLLAPGRPAPPTRSPAPEEPPPSRGKWVLVALLAPAGGLLLLVVAIVVVLAAGAAQDDCTPTGGGGLPGGFTGPGSLGGVAGTGFTPRQIQAVRSGSPYAGARFAPGGYSATAYGPPWGGIQGSGVATSGGVALAGGAPRRYMVAVDPLQIAHGQLVYLWPNPFAWKGPFLAADTGGAIKGRRIDFYDWRGRLTQLRWAQRDVQASARPIRPGGPDVRGEDPGPSSAPTEAGGGCAAGGGGSLAVSGEVGERIGQLARTHLGSGPAIAGFEPSSVGYAWCAWFATNVWRKAGVPIPVNGWSGYPYTWAQARGQLFKSEGNPPRGPVPPAGAALMYGTTPRPGGDSRHVNLVDRVLSDGSFFVTGGNQDGGRVTRYGPCHLTRSDPARLTGPGCDSRPIYGIAAPTRLRGA
jgi:3D (Asp-Asp-Asp) domain-containing protein